MSYCIIDIIYGIPLTEEASLAMEEINEEIAEEEALEEAAAESEAAAQAAVKEEDEEAESEEPEADESEEEESEEEEEDKDHGFVRLYTSGGSFKPGYCGVKLGQFDECADYEKVRTLKLTPTEKQKAEAKAKLKKVPMILKKLCPKPDVYFIFHSS